MRSRSQPFGTPRDSAGALFWRFLKTIGSTSAVILRKRRTWVQGCGNYALMPIFPSDLTSDDDIRLRLDKRQP